jgi:hypothetical protein
VCVCVCVYVCKCLVSKQHIGGGGVNKEDTLAREVDEETKETGHTEENRAECISPEEAHADEEQGESSRGEEAADEDTGRVCSPVCVRACA